MHSSIVPGYGLGSNKMLGRRIFHQRELGVGHGPAMAFHHRDEFIARSAAALAGPRIPPRAAELFFGFRTVTRPAFFRRTLGGPIRGQACQWHPSSARQQEAEGITSAEGHAVERKPSRCSAKGKRSR